MSVYQAISNVTAYVARTGIVVKHEGTAADAGRLRLNEPQHGLDGNGGVDCSAACPEDLEAGLDRHGIGRRDHRACVPVASWLGFDGG